MDTEKSELLETPQQEEIGMEKEVVSKLEAPEEVAEPVMLSGADGDTTQLAVNGHTESPKETEGDMIVTQNVTLPDEKMEARIENDFLEEKSDIETGPGVVATPEPHESSEKLSDPVAALGKERENIQSDQEPMPENIPEPVPMQTPLADSAPGPEPEKLAECVPEAAQTQETSPEPAMLQQPADQQLPAQEKKMSEQVEAGAEEGDEGKAGNDIPAQPAKKGEEEKVPEKAEAPKGTEPVASKEDQVAEAKPETAAESGTVGAEVAGAEAKREEQVPSAGSLSFPLLDHDMTKDALRTTASLIVLRGLPGSGKSFLACAIADAFKDQCAIICGDDHGIKPEDPEASADGYKALDEAVLNCCSAAMSSSVLIVVDDTNHTHERLARMGEIAKQHHRIPLFLEPHTEWSRDVAQLTMKSKRGLEAVHMEAMKVQLEEMLLPLYFGWFLVSSVQDNVRCTAMDFLKTLDTLEIFKKHLNDFTGKAEKEVDLEQYFKSKRTLHCTSKFCDYGKATGAKEYAQKQAVNELYGSVFELSLTALFVTPRTVGARVSLTEKQLTLWPDDAEKEAESNVPEAASLPLGSRAHITLGCAEGVEAVQTGFDLLKILALQKEGQQEQPTEMELGTLVYYGEGRWMITLREPMCVPAIFSSFYGCKETVPAKKEPEKKKKPKCTIL